MRRILIVKTGTTYESLRALKGDVDAWVIGGFGNGCGVLFEVADVAAGADLPDPGACDGVVVTGSPAMVTDRAPWSERTAAWLVRAVGQGVPVLGICYGHQLLAHALGGRVGFNPNGPEYGTVVVTPTEAAARDALLGEFEGPFKAHMSHSQSVLTLPGGATLLASTRREPCAAFVYRGTAWGVQFHPEFDARTMKVFVLREKDLLAARGVDVTAAFASCIETGCGAVVLRRFLGVVGARQGDRERAARLDRAV